MEVCSGVLIIDYNRPSIKTLKRSDNRSWTEMFNRLFRGKFVCCLLSEPHLFIDGPFMIRFVPSPQRNETWNDHDYNSLCWFVRVFFCVCVCVYYVKLYLKSMLLWLPREWKIKVFCFDHNRWSIGWVNPILDIGDNFVSPSGHVMFYLLYKHQRNTKAFHFNQYYTKRHDLLCNHGNGDLLTW